MFRVVSGRRSRLKADRAHVDRKSSYTHYTTVLNLADIEFPITFKDITRFKRLNAVSINVYGTENGQVSSLRLTDDKKEKNVNFLYLQDSRNDSIRHFAWIKNLSRLADKREKEQEIFLRPISIIRKANKK